MMSAMQPGRAKQGGGHLLHEENRGCEVLSKSKSDWYHVVPVHEFHVDVMKLLTHDWSTRGVQYIERFVNELTQLAEAFVYRSDVRWLFA